MVTYSLKVLQIRQETKDAITLCFKQPGLKKIKYLAGQYLTLIFRINGRRYIRPYSFSSAPGIDPYLEVTIKRVANGIISNHIHDIIKEGDIIEVLPPMGDFIYENFGQQVECINLWATGSGITPLISIAKYVLSDINGPVINLFYGNRNSETAIFLEQIKTMSNTFPTRFRAKYFYSQPIVTEDLPDVIQGRISSDAAIELLKGEVNVGNSVHYICGAPGFKESVKSALNTLGLEREKVFSEDFELIKDPKDFEKIRTQIVRIHFQNLDHEIEVVKGKSILEAALDANIELPYSCQTGNCSTCKGILLHGDAEMIGLKNERTDLSSQEYLLCCSYPQSANVYIKID